MTQKAYDGHIGLQVFRRNAEDLRELLADGSIESANICGIHDSIACLTL